MRQHFIRNTAAALAALLCISTVPFTASAEESLKIVVIGDSIMTGAKLEDVSKSCTALIESGSNAEVQSFAKDTYTTEDILTCLAQEEVQTALSNADVILLSAGMQDIMIPFFESIEESKAKYNLDFDSFDALYQMPLSDTGLTLTQLNRIGLSMNSAAQKNQTTCHDNLLKIGEELSQYKKAQVVAVNAYNFTNILPDFDSLSANRQNAYKSIMNTMDKVMVNYLNAAYTEMSETYGYSVIDSYTAFSGQAYLYTNLNSMDYNPNEKGHEWIATEVLSAINTASEVTMGDVNGDTVINAADAAIVLQHAASVGAGNGGTLNRTYRAAADVNNDGKANASDASSILRYAAIYGSTGEVTDFT